MTTLRLAGRCIAAATLVPIVVAATSSSSLAPGAGADPLRDSFVQPPASARPWALWYWIDGRIDREGITRDLESMARNGLGGVVLGDISHHVNEDSKPFLGPEWQEMFAHTLREARRLGLVVSTCPSAGWCALGGPWVKPEDSMQVLVWSTTRVEGPRRFTGRLSQPQTVEGHYRDVALIAYPSAAEPLGELARISAAGTTADAARLVDGAPASTVIFRAGPADPAPAIDLEFKQPVTIRGVALEFTDPPRLGAMELQAAGADGRFVTLTEFSGRVRGPLGKVFRAVADVEPTTTTRLRIVLGKGAGNSLAEIAEIDVFGENYIPRWTAKSGTDVDVVAAMRPDPLAAQVRGIPAGSLQVLTGRMAPDGTLDWEIPAGRWTILRFGHTSRGARNRPATAGAGLETDKFRAEVTRFHFDQFIGKFATQYREFMGSTFVGMWQDSWETGFQNWSPVFVDEFRRRRGYDPIPHLPSMSGRAVGNGLTAERFLWDVRRTIADLCADNYLGTLTELGRPYGIGVWFQPINKHFTDGLQAVGRSTGAEANIHFNARHKPRREFPREKFCASAAHLYGQTVVHNEAATAAAPTGAFVSTPASMRELINASFCTGINQNWMHVFLHQPWPRAEPGLSWKWGLQFQRNNTWFEELDGWSAYVSRSQHLLRQGLAVVDLVAFPGEAVPTEAGVMGSVRELRNLPAGIDYDVCNAEVILERMAVRDGRIVLPDGMSYALLFLTGSADTMRPAVLRKLRDLVQAGATLVGNAPKGSPSLEGYPGSDEELLRLVAEVWGRGPVDPAGRRLGGGRVFAAKDLARALAERGVGEDFSFAAADPEALVEYYHRSTPEAELYFVANRRDRPVHFTSTFRVDGRAPELWHPDTGAVEPAGVFARAAGRTTLPLRLPAYGAVFVVFRRPAGADPIVAVAREGRTVIDARASAAPVVVAPEILDVIESGAGSPALLRTSEAGRYELVRASGRTESIRVEIGDDRTLTGPWEVTFAPNRGAPARVTFDALAGWPSHPDDGVKYFSGTAVYARRFDVRASDVAAGRRLYLDLGDVREVAGVSVNGQSLGGLWKTPFRVDLTAAVRPGSNELSIAVTNLWVNRMIGDERMFPDDAEWVPDSQAEWRGFVMKGLPPWFAAWSTGRGERPTGRVAFSTVKFYAAKDPLVPSGLLGPVRLVPVAEVTLAPR